MYTSGKSWQEIADAFDTYPNKVRREAMKSGLISRTKAEAQSIALSQNKRPHPTKGKKRPDNVKIQISEKLADNWAGLTKDEREDRSQQARDQWNSLSEDKQKEIHHAASIGIREAAKNGSKLENFLYKELTKLGHFIEFHKEHQIINERLHIDMFLPKINTAIEIDGPSHFKPIWGTEILQKSKKADAEKAGLLLTKGLVLIRVKHVKALSEKYKRDILLSLHNILSGIEKKYPDKHNRFIEIGE
jgi:very-short-patch-repair endonuclease